MSPPLLPTLPIWNNVPKPTSVLNLRLRRSEMVERSNGSVCLLARWILAGGFKVYSAYPSPLNIKLSASKDEIK